MSSNICTVSKMKIGGPYVGRKSILELFGERGGGLAGGGAGDDRTKKS